MIWWILAGVYLLVGVVVSAKWTRKEFKESALYATDENHVADTIGAGYIFLMGVFAWGFFALMYPIGKLLGVGGKKK